MSQRKADLVQTARDRGLDITPTMTIKEIEALLAANPASEPEPPLPPAEPEPDATEPVVGETIDDEADQTFAKAGKRSAKAVAEAEAEATRQVRHQADAEIQDKPKKLVKPSRSWLERRGRKYRQAQQQIDPRQVYDLPTAVDLIIKTSTTKFDSTVEVAVALGVDIRQADQNIRSAVVLPSGSGRRLRIAVAGEADDLTAAKAAGADLVADDDFWQSLDRGQCDFDLLIATPQIMARLGPYAKLLGPRGLMPNPKSGTVTRDVVRAVAEAKAGRVEYRADETGVIHLAIGKVSFGSDKLVVNLQAFLVDLRSNQPASLKGKTYIKSIYLTTTMGPSVRLVNSAGADA